MGRAEFIWGDNPLLVFVVILAASLAACGLGAFIASLAGTPEQGNIITSIISIFFGLLGGAFFNVQAIPALAPLSRLTPNYWAGDAFTRLALNQADIGTNLLVLLAIGAGLFGVGFVIFSRRLEV
jgi:ABC-2 type transport system permease protein